MENEDKKPDIDIDIRDLEEKDNQVNDKIASDVIDISAEDLAEEERKVYPGLSNSGYSGQKYVKSKIKEKAASFVSNTIVYQTLFGIIGGILAWIVTESVLSRYGYVGLDLGKLIVDAAVYTALCGLCIGTAISSSEGFICRIRERAIKDGSVGFVAGIIGGALGGIIAELIFGSFGVSYAIMGLPKLLLRGVSWSILGLILGISQGFIYPTTQKIKNGILGGSIGGFAGGIMFQILQDIMRTSTGSRLLALIFVGALIGLFLGLIERIRRTAWLKIVEGPLCGKEFTLYSGSTLIGSDAKKCQIVLMKDKMVSPIHVTVKEINGTYIITDMDTAGGTFLNKRRINNQELKNNDLISIGATVMEFRM